MQIRTLTEEEQSMLLKSIEEKQFKETTIALDLQVPNALAPRLERLSDLLRENQLCVIITD